MSTPIAIEIAGVASLVPLALLHRRHADPAPISRIAALLAAIAGTGLVAWLRVDGAWRADLATALWWSASVALVVFGLSAVRRPAAWRLGAPLALYLLPISLAALVFGRLSAPGPLIGGAPWFWLHLAVSLVTYGLVTLGAVAAAAFQLQERALKRRRLDGWAAGLPAVRDSEEVLVAALATSSVVLAAGILSGFALRWSEGVALLRLDHKTLFSFAALIALVALLVIHQRSGMRGRQMVRLVLTAYLLLTLGYLGVKFAGDVIA